MRGTINTVYKIVFIYFGGKTVGNNCYKRGNVGILIKLSETHVHMGLVMASLLAI